MTGALPLTWYRIIVYIHIVSAIIWVGGILFLGLVAAPAVRRLSDAKRTDIMDDIGRRFRTIGYTLLVVLAITGIIQAWVHGATITNVINGTFFATRFGARLGLKLLFIAAMLAVSIVHDFYIGPQSVRVARAGQDASHLRKIASWLARLTALFALIVIAYAMVLVR